MTWLAVLAVLLLAPSPARGEDPTLARALARVSAPPLGLPPVPTPPDNRPTAARVALGRKLFFDRRLSRGGTMSCAMCHLPEQGFTSQELARPIGTEGRSLRRNSPTILNVAYLRRLFHDGRETALETQALAPLLDRNEMANPSLGSILETIRALPDYRGLFEAAFGAGPSPDRIGAAIASYERTLLLAGSPFDRWRFGAEAGAMTPAALEGFRLFTGKGGCAACHTVAADHALFTDQRFHDTGVAARRAAPPAPVPVELAPGLVVPLSPETLATIGDPEPADLGRHEVTQDPADLYGIRTPSLRNVALTAPYMHDGSMGTLEEVVRYYERGGHRHPGLDPRVRPLGLTEGEVAALVAFLESLTGEGVGELIEEARAPHATSRAAASARPSQKGIDSSR